MLPGAAGMVAPIGQRMPVLLTLLGLFVTALLPPRLRPSVPAACTGAGLSAGGECRGVAAGLLERLHAGCLRQAPA